MSLNLFRRKGDKNVKARLDHNYDRGSHDIALMGEKGRKSENKNDKKGEVNISKGGGGRYLVHVDADLKPLGRSSFSM